MEIEEKTERINGIISMIVELKTGEQTPRSKITIQKLQQELDKIINS